MKKNMETFGIIVKITMSVVIAVLYIIGILAGPFSHVLLVLAIIFLAVFVARSVIARFFMD